MAEQPEIQKLDDDRERDLSPLRRSQERFVALWGQMGANWGIARTMAEVHATLFIMGRPMNTDEIMDFLQISRGNASMTLRALVDWGLVQRLHMRGDRKEYFQAEQDVWAIFRAIVRERVKRALLEFRDVYCRNSLQTFVECLKANACQWRAREGPQAVWATGSRRPVSGLQQSLTSRLL